MKRINIFVVLTMSVSALFAQTQYDAARIVGTELNGTARFVGMGGAMGALGADISVIGTNPAGIALFRSHNVSTSFGFNKNMTSSTFNGTKVSDSRTKASYDQIGFVYSNKIGNKTNLRYLNFGFNYHKAANFNRQFSSKGALNGSSLSWQMADMMLGAGYGSQESYDEVLDAENPYTSEYFYGTPFLGLMGARTGLVDDFTDNEGFTMLGWNGDMGEYYSREEGGINQYDFNMSFNVQDRYYFGVTLGVYDVNYNRYSSYSETLLDDKGADNGNFTLNNWFSTQGTGYDLKFGFIARPFEYSPFRVGFAIHTPVWYMLTDRYTATLDTDVLAMPEPYTENLSQYLNPDYVWDYRMRTPWKFNVNMGTTFSGVLAVGAEYEYSDYSYINYRDYNGYDLSSSNIATDKYLKGVHTLKLGMEAMLTPSFSFRAGYNYVTSAFKDGSARYIPNVETLQDKYIWFDETRTDPEYHNIKARNTITLGLGYSGRVVYADVAYKYDFYKSDFFMFDDYINDGINIIDRNNSALVDHNRHQVLFTVGCRF
ncbi:hypothetical protein H6A30_00135 [Bacteroides caecigallinarum]|uniref:hypothetical protein n=1 Tax=Bacteroides caecigallinarum TaxID=1411144 RepID=UPI00195E8521|nr:hypothetical protein [Bacteroides caecigallinarum]MBM6888718.1 hypothetical protein [Bacteroides caecigallinarum]